MTPSRSNVVSLWGGGRREAAAESEPGVPLLSATPRRLWHDGLMGGGGKKKTFACHRGFVRQLTVQKRKKKNCNSTLNFHLVFSEMLKWLRPGSAAPSVHVAISSEAMLWAPIDSATTTRMFIDSSPRPRCCAHGPGPLHPAPLAPNAHVRSGTARYSLANTGARCSNRQRSPAAVRPRRLQSCTLFCLKASLCLPREAGRIFTSSSDWLRCVNTTCAAELTARQMWEWWVKLASAAQWSSGGVSVLTLVGCGFDPWPGYTKDCKNGTHCLPARCPVFRVGIGGSYHLMIPWCSTAAVHRSLRRCWDKCRRTNFASTRQSLGLQL